MANADVKGIKILIVDDSAKIQSLRNRLLDVEGYKVIGQLASGNGLLEAIVQTFPDLIRLDYHLPGCDSYVWFGVVAPAAAPAKIIARLNAALAKAALTPSFRDRLSEQGYDLLNSTPKQTTSSARDEISKWSKIVQASGAKVD